MCGARLYKLYSYPTAVSVCCRYLQLMTRLRDEAAAAALGDLSAGRQYKTWQLELSLTPWLLRPPSPPLCMNALISPPSPRPPPAHCAPPLGALRPHLKAPSPALPPFLPLKDPCMLTVWWVWQDAVVLALSFDMSLACATANRPEDEPALKRSLWLTIARHIVQQHPSQDQVNHITTSCCSLQTHMCPGCRAYVMSLYIACVMHGIHRHSLLITHHSSLLTHVTHHSSCIIQHSSLIIHHSSLINHHSFSSYVIIE